MKIKVLDSTVDSNMQVPQTGNFPHEVSGQDIHHDNTVGESIVDNSLSSFVNDCPPNDFNIDDVSEIYGQPSFDIRSICPKCACAYIGELCLRCQQNAEYDASVANMYQKQVSVATQISLEIVVSGYLGSSSSHFFLHI